MKLKLTELSRGILAKKYPILIQGPTSAGKTSIIEYIAKRTGHRFVRINNHEQTDLQEYVGTYVPDSEGRLVFVEVLCIKNLLTLGDPCRSLKEGLLARVGRIEFGS